MNASATQDCRNAPSDTESSWPPREGLPVSLPNNRGKWVFSSLSVALGHDRGFAFLARQRMVNVQDVDFGPLLLPNHLFQRHRAQIGKYVGIEARPQLVGHAPPVVETVLLAAAFRGIDGLVDGQNHICHRDGPGRARPPVPTTRPSDAGHKAVPAQLAQPLSLLGS